MSAPPHQVVIVGGGFGGLSAARELAGAPVAVTLVDRRNHHLFQPLLYQVATAALNPSDIAIPIRRIVRRQANVKVILAEARSIGAKQALVRVDSGVTGTGGFPSRASVLSVLPAEAPLNDDRPRPLREVHWRRVFDEMRSATRRHRALVLAGGIAFFAFLSILPALAALVSVYGLLANPEDVAHQVNAVAGGVPPEVQRVIHDQMAALAARSPRTLSIEAAIGIVAAVWAATKGMKVLITGLSMAFGQQESRGFIRLNATAFLFTLASIVAGVIGIACVIVLPVVLPFLHPSRLGEELIRWLRWPTLALLVLVGLSIAYRFGPARPPPRRRWVTPGSLLATALWLGGSAIFSRAASASTRTDWIDGSLGVVITILTWFLLSAYVVILGAELDGEIARQGAAAPLPEHSDRPER